MKLRKILLTTALIFVLAFSMTACGGGQDEDTSTDEGTKTESTTEETHTIVGTLQEWGTDSVILKTNDGDELAFDTADAAYEIKNGLHEGNWIQITYKGEIDGTDTGKCEVTKVIDDNDNKAIVKEKKKTEEKIDAVDETVYATAGVHVRASYSIDSKIVGVLAVGQKVQRTGKCENGWSRIEFDGTDGYVYGDYLSNKKPKAKAKPATTKGKKPQTAQHPSNGKPQHPKKVNPKKVTKHTVKGTIVDGMTNSLVVSIKDANGNAKEYEFYTGQAKIKTVNGLKIGNVITITYTGNLSNNPVILSIKDKNANKAAESTTQPEEENPATVTENTGGSDESTTDESNPATETENTTQE